MWDVLLELGRWFETILKPLLNLLEIGGTGSFLALIIFIFGVLFVCVTIGRYYYFCGFLKQAIGMLDGVDNEEKFNNKYDEIDDNFKNNINNEKLSDCWKEFTETIIRPGKDDPKQIVLNTARPDNYFYASAAKFTTPFLGIIPNIFVGVGLFFTFAGLIAALTKAVDGLEGANTTQMQESIEDLLLITSAKFYTSLMALGFSILLTITLRLCTNWRDRLFKELSDKLEKGMRYASVAEFSKRQLNEMKEQTEQLKGFSTSIAVAIGENVEKAVEKAMQPVVDGIGNLGQSTAGAVQETIGKIQQEAGDSFATLSGRLDTLATTLDGLSEKLSGTSKEFEEQLLKTLKTLDESSKKIADELKGAASSASQEMTDSVKKIGEAAEKISEALSNASGEAVNQARTAITDAGKGVATEFNQAGEAMRKALDEHLSDLTKAMQGFEKSLTGANDNFVQLKNDLGEASAQITTSAKNMTTAAGSFEGIAEPIAKASKAVESSVSTLGQTANTMQAAIQTLEEEMRENAELWRRHSQKFDEVDENIGKIFSEVNIGIEESQKRMSEFVNKMDKAFKDALASQTNAIEEFGELVQELVEEHKSRTGKDKG